MATASRSHPNDGDWLAFRDPQIERPRPSDPGADEDVPSERESEEGRESDPRDRTKTPSRSRRDGLRIRRHATTWNGLRSWR